MVHLRCKWRRSLAFGDREPDTTGRFTGTLVQTTGPAFDAALFQPSLVRGVAVGTAAFTFDDIGGGTFAYTLNGISQTKAIVRQDSGRCQPARSRSYPI